MMMYRSLFPGNLFAEIDRCSAKSSRPSTSAPASGARAQQQATVQINDLFAGRFKRVVSLPDDIDPESVSARYRDGVLHVTVARRGTSQPRRISVH